MTNLTGFCSCYPDDSPEHPAPDCGIPSHRALGRAQRGHIADLTEAQAERLAAIEAAPDAEESLRMRLANAIAAQFRKEIARGYVSPTQAVDAADAALRVITEDARA